MLKVILIDDEPLVLEGLRTMVEWNKYNYRIVGEASDGDEGFQLIRERNPDLVITDMRMPIMNGIELIEKCQNELDSNCKFVVLSGYNDFDYVKKALVLKIHDYLLKPIDSDEIHEMLEKLYAKITKERTREEKIKDDLEVVKRSSIKRLIHGDVKDSLINRIEFILDVNDDTDYTLGSLHLYQDKEDWEVEVNNHKISKCKNVLGSFLHDHYIIYNQSLNNIDFILIGNRKNSETYKYDEFIKIMNKDGLIVSFVIGQKFDDLRRINEQTEQFELLKLNMFYGPQNHHYEADVKKIDFNDMNTLEDQSIEQHNFEPNSYRINEISKRFRQEYISPHHVKQWYEAYLNYMYHSSLYSNEGKEWLGGKIKELKNFAYLNDRELKKYLLYLVQKSQKYISETKELEPVEQIKAYIEEHHEQDIKLKNVARIFGFNSVYIGQLFMKETGMKYNDYVMDVRMNKAKQLLKHTNLKVKEIAVQVGYKNPDYFVLKFKEKYKFSPMAYRRKASYENKSANEQ